MSNKSQQRKYNREHAQELAENSKVEFVPASVSGVMDAVQMKADCVLTVFSHDENNEITGIPETGQTSVPVKLMASYQNGTVSISVKQGEPFMMTVRMEDIMALLRGASDRSHRAVEKMKKKGEPKE